MTVVDLPLEAKAKANINHATAAKVRRWPSYRVVTDKTAMKPTGNNAHENANSVMVKSCFTSLTVQPLGTSSTRWGHGRME